MAVWGGRTGQRVCRCNFLDEIFTKRRFKDIKKLAFSARKTGCGPGEVKMVNKNKERIN
jgi:hypothetical protein